MESSFSRLTKQEFSALARVHAHLCGDGCICIYKTSEPDRINRAEIIYCNTNPALIDSFRKDMTFLFGVKMTYIPKQKALRVKSIRIVNSLLELGKYGCREWCIPPMIRASSTDIRLEWIKAFLYDEGYLIEKKNLVRVKSMNRNGLEDMAQMLSDMGIYSWITGKNCDNSWYLNIRRMQGLDGFYKEPCRKKVARGGFEPPTSGL